MPFQKKKLTHAQGRLLQAFVGHIVHGEQSMAPLFIETEDKLPRARPTKWNDKTKQHQAIEMEK
jgi:hypothetical protein